jgi:hypothetical protein
MCAEYQAESQSCTGMRRQRKALFGNGAANRTRVTNQCRIVNYVAVVVCFGQQQ